MNSIPPKATSVRPYQSLLPFNEIIKSILQKRLEQEHNYKDYHGDEMAQQLDQLSALRP